MGIKVRTIVIVDFRNRDISWYRFVLFKILCPRTGDLQFHRAVCSAWDRAGLKQIFAC